MAAISPIRTVGTLKIGSAGPVKTAYSYRTFIQQFPLNHARLSLPGCELAALRDSAWPDRH